MLIRSTALAAFAAIAGGSAALAQEVPAPAGQQVPLEKQPGSGPPESQPDVPPSDGPAPVDAPPPVPVDATTVPVVDAAAPIRADERHARKGEIRDPWEKLNRRLFATNLVIDKYTLEPAAKAYRAVTPRRLRRGIANMLANMRVPKNVANNILQGRPLATSKTVFRFLVNSTVGIAGFFDVAAKLGVQRREEDFGQTLAVWGVRPGPYLFVPLLGPSSVRDTLGAMVDNAFEPFNYFHFRGETPLRTSRFVLTALSGREGAIEAIDSINSSAADPYTAFKAAYTQNRAFEIRNGKESFDDFPDFDDGDPGSDLPQPGDSVSSGEPDSLPDADPDPEPEPEPAPEPDPAPTLHWVSAHRVSGQWASDRWVSGNPGSTRFDIVPFVQEAP